MSLPKIVHVGFAKCASTFLQAFWRQHPDVNLVFKSGFFSSTYSLDVVRYSRMFENGHIGRCLVESDEHLLMNDRHPLLGSHGMTLEGVEEVCKRLKSALPQAKLLVVLRDQLDMMVSTYSQYLLGGGTHTLDAFASEMLCSSNDRRNYYSFYYDRILEILEDSFPGQWKAILFDDLTHRTERHLEGICEFMEIESLPFRPSFRDRRVGLSKLGMPLVRTLNRCVVRRHAPRFLPDLWVPQRAYKFLCNVCRLIEYYGLKHFVQSNRHQLASQKLIDVMEVEFAESNRLLSQMLDTDLAGWVGSPSLEPAPDWSKASEFGKVSTLTPA